MVINGKIAIVYDIEIFPNLFTLTAKNTENNEIIVIEISERFDPSIGIEKLRTLFLNRNYIFVGYNNIHYDNPIVNYILEYGELMSYKNHIIVCGSLQHMSEIIISKDPNDKEKWKRWKYADNFATLDLLTMLFSEKLRVSLKAMQVTLQYKNVQEYAGDFNQFVPVDDIDEVLKYNLNDVDSTTVLLNRCKKDIELRLWIKDYYKVDVLSSDGVSIGKEILKTKYLQDTHKSWYDIKDLRSPCDFVKLNEVILPIVSFKTPLLQDLLKEMKTLVVSPGIKGWNKKFYFHDTLISIGVGGIHSINEPEYIIPKEDELLIDTDAASLYPSLLINWEFYPQHLGKEFLTTYSNIKKERIEAKHNGESTKNTTLKLTLNSVTGLMQSEYSWLYSPKDVMRIRMNGQLLLLMLAEKLILATGCRIIQYNTDGLFLLLKKNQFDNYNKAVKEFEDISRLSMESDYFEGFYQYAINDYLAICDGYSKNHDPKFLKKKGLFIDEITLGKGMQAMIIPYAINQWCVNRTPVTETIKNCKDIHKFITYQKVDKKFSVEYNSQLITHINRFYMSTDGYYLNKCSVDREGNRTDYKKIVADSGVTIVNNIEEIKEFPSNINYQWYIKEAEKIVQTFQCKQLTMF